MDLPLAHVERIMRNAGATSLAEDAIAELRDSTTEIAAEVARDAVQHAQDERRETVTVADVRYAVEH